MARYKNFSKAAEALYIGQPALSRRISGLERQLGVQLFLRSNKAVELTRAGEILQREGQHIIEQLEQLEVKMQAAGQGAQGSIRVTTMGRLSDRVSQTIRRTIAALPDCDVEMEVLVPGEQGDGLEPLDTDVAFLVGSYPSDDTGQKHVVPLEDAPFSFLLPAGHPLAGRKEICPEDLRGERLLLLKVSRVPVQIQGLLQAVSRTGPCQPVFRKNLASIVLDVEMGKGIGFLPAFEAEGRCQSSSGLVYRPAAGLPVGAGVFLTWGEERQDPATDRFIRTFLKLWGTAETG
ncbi:MAG TPA: LysR family transcriptional regulator [Candidatus Intestinimonas stercoravium]|nr:LysR family transcriptional regulator [Candidatus Intestinimonas stercoravium]